MRGCKKVPIEEVAAGRMKKKADMIKYTKNRVKNACILEWEKLSTAEKGEKPSAWQRAKAWAPLAGVGGAIGVGKGFAEKSIEGGVTKLVGGKRLNRSSITSRGLREGLKKNLPWAIARGATGAGSTLVIGMAMSEMMDKLKKRTKS